MFTQVLAGSPCGDVRQIRNVSTGLCLRALASTDFSIRSEISTGGAPCLDTCQGPLNTPVDVFHCGARNLPQEWVIA